MLRCYIPPKRVEFIYTLIVWSPLMFNNDSTTAVGHASRLHDGVSYISVISRLVLLSVSRLQIFYVYTHQPKRLFSMRKVKIAIFLRHCLHINGPVDQTAWRM